MPLAWRVARQGQAHHEVAGLQKKGPLVSKRAEIEQVRFLRRTSGES